MGLTEALYDLIQCLSEPHAHTSADGLAVVELVIKGMLVVALLEQARQALLVFVGFVARIQDLE